jgi:hypothetical protein
VVVRGNSTAITTIEQCTAAVAQPMCEGDAVHYVNTVVTVAVLLSLNMQQLMVPQLMVPLAYIF